MYQKFEITERITEELLDTFREWLAQQNDDIEIVITSDGGTVYACKEISLLIEEYKKRYKVITVVNNYCRSAAALIFILGDERLISKNATLLFHSPYLTVDNMELNFYDIKYLLRLFKRVYRWHKRQMRKVMPIYLVQYIMGKKCDFFEFTADEAVEWGVATDYYPTDNN